MDSHPLTATNAPCLLSSGSRRWRRRPGTALVDLYFEHGGKEAKEEAKCDEENEDCLVRVYLGEREADTHVSYNGNESTLRNFPVRLDRWENAVGKDGVRVLARQMAVGLAVLHWRAKVDGVDVEFVLGGPSRTTEQRPVVGGYDGLTKGAAEDDTHLWVNPDRLAESSGDVDPGLRQGELGGVDGE
ncbi:MAG: hypothetical protein Q9207_007964 [Kuettlingeria erythrocarpa]